MDLKIYTKEEAQKILRLGTNKIGYLLQSRKLKAIKEGRKYLIPASAIDEYIEQGLSDEIQRNC